MSSKILTQSDVVVFEKDLTNLLDAIDKVVAEYFRLNGTTAPIGDLIWMVGSAIQAHRTAITEEDNDAI